MKHIRFALTFFVFILLVACQTAEEPTPTETAVSLTQSTATATILPPTATATATDTPAPSATATTAPTQTMPLTATKTPMPTNTARPTSTATTAAPSTPTISEPALPPPPGYIAFLWSQEPEDEYAPDVQNLYFAIPGASLTEWEIRPVVTDMTEPDMFLSPDKTKLAISFWEDSNGDGITSVQAPDIANVYVYDLTDNSFNRVTDNQQPGWPLAHWLSDSQNFTYRLYKDIFMVTLDGSPPRLLLDRLAGYVHWHLWSPDSQWLAIFSTADPTSTSGLIRLDLYKYATDELITLTSEITNGDLAWSPNSQWLAFTQGTNHGLFVVDMNTLATIEIVDSSYRNFPAWSPGGEWLAFVERSDTTSKLLLWDPSTMTSSQLLDVAGTITPPVWSPDNTHLVFSVIQEDKTKMLVYDITDGNQDLVIDSLPPEINSPLGWSPDGEWILFYSFQGDQTGLYVIHRLGGQAYRILDTSGTALPEYLTWLPNQ